MADHWFRIYNTVRHDRKIRKLSDQQFRVWIMLLSLASEENGKIPQDFEDLAMELHMSVGKTKEALKSLLSAGLIEPLGENGYIPHKWNERQFKSDCSTERVKRYRERSKTVSETPPETEQNRTEQSIGNFAMFYQTMPKQERYSESEQEYLLATRKASPEAIQDAAMAYAKRFSRDDAKFAVSPLKWLQTEMWRDTPAPINRKTAFNSPEEIEGQRRAREKAYGQT